MAIGSHPISFKLLNSDGESVLGIFDGQGQTSKLEIKNISRQNWQLKTVNSEKATEHSYHFELKFRPGTLNVSKTNLISVDAGEAGWKISEPTPTPDGLSLYLLSTKPISVEKDKSTVLMLHNLNADGSDGSRGTRVELKWAAALEYAGSSDVPAGYRVQQLSVVNMRGEPQIPLLLSIVGTDKIFNDGATNNTLKLHITNRLKQGTIDLLRNSQFTFSFDYSDQAWALAPAATTKTIEIDAGTNFLPKKDVETISPKWWITPSQDVVPLGPNQFIEVVLSNIVTANAIGKTNLYVHYENIPGYQDGDFVSVIEKSAVVYKEQNVGLGESKPEKRIHVKGAGDQEIMIQSADDNGVKWSLQSSAGASNGRFEIVNRTTPKGHFTILKDGKIGMGTADPETHLHVKGDGDQQVVIESKNGGKWSLQSKGETNGRFEIFNPVANTEKFFAILSNGNVGIGTQNPQERLQVEGNLRMNGDDQVIFFQDNGQIKSADNNHRILFRRSEQKLELREFGSIIFSPGSLFGTETAKAVVLGNGNVGIGTPTPAKHLHVQGTSDQEVMIESTDTGGVQWSLQSSRGSRNGRFEIVNRSNEKSHVTILKDGNVGIGTTAPATHVHVRGDSDQEIMIESADTNGIKWSLQSSSGASNGRFEIVDRTNGRNRFTIGKNGNVGIGNINPTNGILHVSGSAVTTVRGFGYLNKETTGFPGSTQNCPYSIWADDRIGALEFNAHSDERMKNIQGRSNSGADLLTLLGIEITDYSFRDVIGKGNRTAKKVIGQQVEKVFPQAVSKQTDAVPDIYQQASIRDGWVALPNELNKGERVKLITEKGESVHEVLDVTPDKFRVDFKDDEDTVFVFGREVDDFVTVDYDAIAMLNVSATQQLKKELDQEVKTLRAENAELRAANDALAKRLQLLESRFEATVSAVHAGNGSNGNGRH